jgi:hypothetical protein
MTTVQLAQRLLRHLTVKDLALLSGDDALHVLDAMNAGLQQFYALAPASLKQTTLSGVLQPAQTVTLTVTNGSAVFSGYTATSAQRGYTIRIEGDDNENEIVASNGLLDDYLGTTGTKAAQVWGDCLPLNGVIERLTSEPRLDTGAFLAKEPAFRERGGWSSPAEQRHARRDRRIGEPSFYWIEAVGQSQGGAPAFLLRVDALPDRAYRVRVDAELGPARVTFPDLTTPVALPLNDAHVEAYVLPLCAAALLDSPLWQDADAKRHIRERAGDAIPLIGLLGHHIAKPSNRVRTPAGY